MKKIGIVVPVYNEQDNLKEFHKHVTEVMSHEDYDYTLFFVDDGSKDASRAMLQKMCQEDPHVEAFLLSRNCGHQMALTCGLDNAEGDAIITMDGDMQHPPELIPQLLRLWEEGNEIVQTKRMATEDAGFFKNITSKCYYKLINALSKVEITPGGSDFRLMDRQAVEAFKLYRERARFIRGLITTLGFNVAVLEFVAPPRFAGHSKFNLHKMLHFALDGITAFSNLPLRWAFYLGIIMGLCSLGTISHVIYVKYIAQDAVPGWSTLTAAVLFLGGLQMMGLGILGEYIGRIFEEIKHRPLYIVAKHLKSGK